MSADERLMDKLLTELESQGILNTRGDEVWFTDSFKNEWKEEAAKLSEDLAE